MQLPIGSDFSGPTSSMFCTRGEHRRPENTNHNFNDHAIGVISAIAKRLGASHMDTMALGCFVAYETSGGRNLTQALNTLDLGRCDKTTKVNAGVNDPVLEDPAGILPAADEQAPSFLAYWKNRGFTAPEAAALMTTHTLLDTKLINMHEYDLEYVNLFAFNFNENFTCVAEDDDRDNNRDDEIFGKYKEIGKAALQRSDGDEDVTGFTSKSGRLSNDRMNDIWPDDSVSNFDFEDDRKIDA